MTLVGAWLSLCLPPNGAAKTEELDRPGSQSGSHLREVHQPTTEQDHNFNGVPVGTSADIGRGMGLASYRTQIHMRSTERPDVGGTRYGDSRTTRIDHAGKRNALSLVPHRCQAAPLVVRSASPKLGTRKGIGGLPPVMRPIPCRPH